MNHFLKTSLIVLFFLAVQSPFASAQGVDELMQSIETQEIQFQDLADAISVMPDQLTGSLNELDSKGQELIDLSKDLTRAYDMAEKATAELDNAMDEFMSEATMFMEEKCMGMEKDFEKFLGKVDPILEAGREPAYILDMISNRYDEKFLLKSFQKAYDASLEVADDLSNLREAFAEFAANCK